MVPMAATINTVDAAATVGAILNSISENIRSGSVILVVPTKKRTSTSSSSDSMKQKTPAAMMPGLISGRVTFMNVLKALAPRFLAASSSEVSKR